MASEDNTTPPADSEPLSRVDASGEEPEPFPRSALSRLLSGGRSPPIEADFHALHPHVRALTAADVESCVVLEETAFSPNERASREKFQYRLSKCGELSLGIFSTALPSSTVAEKAATASAATPADSALPDAREVLIAHAVATLCGSPFVTDNSMGIAPNWDSSTPPTTLSDPANSDKDIVGHNEHGRTLALHSVCVLPEYHGMGLGSILVKAYIQRMEDAGLADRLALITRPELVKWYERFGLRDAGKSEAQFGGGEWISMVYNFTPK